MATQLVDTASIEAIIDEMTVREKAACITGGSSFYTRVMEKYGIDVYKRQWDNRVKIALET